MILNTSIIKNNSPNKKEDGIQHTNITKITRFAHKSPVHHLPAKKQSSPHKPTQRQSPHSTNNWEGKLSTKSTPRVPSRDSSK
mmetsp:Transcript_35494/g.43463  ORF Transcript_35494/g.43463 Transcript_35494/m.43463 type:complete len:83 (+) Transcript_35494:112-360(+)